MSESGFNSAGAFSGGEADGLRSGIEAAMKVMGGDVGNQQDHMPSQVTPEIIDNTAKEVASALTIQDKNRIIAKHYDDLGVDDAKQTTQSIAAFERAVMKKLGR